MYNLEAGDVYEGCGLRMEITRVKVEPEIGDDYTYVSVYYRTQVIGEEGWLSGNLCALSIAHWLQDLDAKRVEPVEVVWYCGCGSVMELGTDEKGNRTMRCPQDFHHFLWEGIR